MFQRSSDPAGFDPDYGIGLGIERRAAAKDFYANRVGLDAVGPAGKQFVHNIGEKPASPLGHGKL